MATRKTKKTKKPKNDSGDRSVNAVVVDATGAMLSSVTATDGESFYSFLHAIEDISQDLPDVDAIEEAYSANAWFTEMDKSSEGHVYVTDEDGNVRTNRRGAWKVEAVTPGKGLRAVRCLPDGAVVVAGVSGVVHRRDSAGWTPMGDGLGATVNDLAGRSASDLFAVGDAGLVAHFDGRVWTRLDLPTKTAFNGALIAGDTTYLCGVGGVLYRGRPGAWEAIGGTKMDLFGLALLKDRVWVACGGEGAGVLTGSTLEIKRDTFAAYSIHSTGGFVVFAGNEMTVRYDGKSWEGYGYGD